MVPGFLVNFILKVAAPFVFSAVNKARCPLQPAAPATSLLASPMPAESDTPGRKLLTLSRACTVKCVCLLLELVHFQHAAGGARSKGKQNPYPACMRRC
jgi:hypothetical protein